MKHVAYYRVSTKKQGESGLGLEAQKSIIKHYYPSVVAEYTEVESGKSTANRPELEAAIKLCQRKKLALVVAKVDRLARNVEDTLRIYRRLQGRLSACDLPLSNGDISAFKFALTLHAAIAERERDMASIRTRDAMAAAKRKGVKFGTPANLTDSARAQGAVIQRTSAKTAYKDQYHHIKWMRDGGLSYEHIARELNGEGKLTRQGKPFKAMTVYRILKRGNGE